MLKSIMENFQQQLRHILIPVLLIKGKIVRRLKY